jgi:hypothetical protein
MIASQHRDRGAKHNQVRKPITAGKGKNDKRLTKAGPPRRLESSALAFAVEVGGFLDRERDAETLPFRAGKRFGANDAADSPRQIDCLGSKIPHIENNEIELRAYGADFFAKEVNASQRNIARADENGIRLARLLLGPNLHTHSYSKTPCGAALVDTMLSILRHRTMLALFWISSRTRDPWDSQPSGSV